MEDFNPDDEPKEPKGEEEEEGDLVGQRQFKFIATQISASFPLMIPTYHIQFMQFMLLLPSNF